MNNFEESPPLPFPPRLPSFTRNYSRGERFEGMNNENYLMNTQGSSATRGDCKSCFVVSTTVLFFVVIFGLYASESLTLGPNTSMLIKPNHLLVESIKVVSLGAANGPMLYGFYKDPPRDVKITWSETHKITLPANTHKEWIYYLNEGSEINISYSVYSRSSSSLVLVITEGDTGLAEWLKDPSFPNLTPSWNVIHGNGSIQKDVSASSIYYIAVGNLNDEYVEVHLKTTIQAFTYNTTESYYKCTPAEDQCTFQLFLSGGNAAVLTSPGRLRVKLSYGLRWVTYLFGIGGIAFLLLLFNYFPNHFRRTEQDIPKDNECERNSLLSRNDYDDIASRGSSYDGFMSEDEEHIEDGQGGKPIKDDENKQICAICFDAPKNCFFIPCGHCVACFRCATRIVKSSGSCPICRRRTEKVRKIYTV